MCTKLRTILLGLEIVVSSGLGTVTPGDDAVLIQTHTDKGSTSQYVEYVLNFAVSMMTENQTFKKPGETGQATQLAPEYTEDWLKFRGYGARRDVGDSYYSETDLMHVSFPQELNKTERPELTQLMWNNMLEAARRLIITTTEGEKREPCFTTKDNRFNHLKQKETFNYTRFQTVFQTAMKLAVLEGRVLLNRKMVGHVLTEQRNDAFFKDLWLEDTRTNSGEEQKRCSNGLSKCIFDGETRTLNMKSPRLLILMAIQSLLASATEIKVVQDCGVEGNRSCTPFSKRLFVLCTLLNALASTGDCALFGQTTCFYCIRKGYIWRQSLCCRVRSRSFRTVALVGAPRFMVQSRGHA